MANLNTDTGETPDHGYDNKYFCDRLYDHRYRCKQKHKQSVGKKYANCIFLIKQDGNVKPLAMQSLSKPGQEQDRNRSDLKLESLMNMWKHTIMMGNDGFDLI